ncbi:unnamed protein product [Trichobilharzia regenti]|nr:unnamed protein product [Trichobilharzia regenti]
MKAWILTQKVRSSIFDETFLPGRSVSFRKDPVEVIVPSEYIDDEYGVEETSETSSDKEDVSH